MEQSIFSRIFSEDGEYGAHGVKQGLSNRSCLEFRCLRFYAAEDENENWEMVDGIQRLSTVARFMEPHLLSRKNF